MKIEKLNLANFRGFEHLEISFEDDVTVIAGVNGVGKSSILQAIRTILSRAMPEFTPSRSKPIYFTDDDIYSDKKALEVSLQLSIEKQKLYAGLQRVREEEGESDRVVLLMQQYVEQEEKSEDFQSLLASRTMTGELEAGVRETQSILNELKSTEHPTIAVYFSPKRQLPGRPKSLPESKPFDVSQAFSRALHDREVELREFMHWFRTQEIFAAEGDEKREKVLETLRKVVQEFIPEFSNLRLVEEPRLGLVVEKSGKPLFLHQLSDGEKGLLAMVFDLTRRLAIANPDSENPIVDGKAIVMIDEIELHLHPKWQRMVIRQMRNVFKNCQFIVTTHSPQVIGQVRPEKLRLLYIDEENKVNIKGFSQSFGMDSSWILQNIMGVPARDYEVEQKLLDIYEDIDSENFKEALTKVESLRDEVGEFPELQEVQALLDRFRLLGKL